MTFPVPPNPRTWSAGDIITVPRLRADAGNLAQLLAKRPLFLGAQLNIGQLVPGSTVTVVTQDTEYVDNWNGHVIGSANYTAQFPGWYWCEGTVLYVSPSPPQTAGYYAAGIRATQNAAPEDLICGILTSDGVDQPAPSACDLVQLNNNTSDTVSMFAFQTVTSGPIVAVLGTPADYYKVSWAGMPDNTIAGTYTGPFGTVVTFPEAAIPWPPGPGTTLTAGVSAGATVITVASATGMLTGGTLGLDYYEGVPVSPLAETVTITGIIGTSIGITATSYPHGGTASPGTVAVPVSAVWMNQQVRDIVNFLAFPPMLRVCKSAQTVPQQAFPASTVIDLTSTTLDNFSGWDPITFTYTFPQAGVYDVYGQVPTQAAVNNISAGISINGGTVQWGDSIRNQTAGNLACARVRKVIRVSASDTMTLRANVTNNAVALENVSNSYATLLAVWRGF